MNKHAIARNTTRSLALIVWLVAASTLTASLASASSAATSVAATMTFTEPLIADGHQGCT